MIPQIRNEKPIVRRAKVAVTKVNEITGDILYDKAENFCFFLVRLLLQNHWTYKIQIGHD